MPIGLNVRQNALPPLPPVARVRMILRDGRSRLIRDDKDRGGGGWTLQSGQTTVTFDQAPERIALVDRGPFVHDITGAPLRQALRAKGIGRTNSHAVYIPQIGGQSEDPRRVGTREVRRTGEPLLMIVSIHQHADADLAHVARTGRLFGLALAGAERWQEHGTENRDDRNDHQQFDQSKGS